MRYITEQELRDSFAGGVPSRFVLPADCRLTPLAVSSLGEILRQQKTGPQTNLRIHTRRLRHQIICRVQQLVFRSVIIPKRDFFEFVIGFIQPFFIASGFFFRLCPKKQIIHHSLYGCSLKNFICKSHIHPSFLAVYR